MRHQAGDRRVHFEAPADIWEIFRVLAEERRRRREIEPTLTMLRKALFEASTSESECHAQKHMREMHAMIDPNDSVGSRHQHGIAQCDFFRCGDYATVDHRLHGVHVPRVLG